MVTPAGTGKPLSAVPLNPRFLSNDPTDFDKRRSPTPPKNSLPRRRSAKNQNLPRLNPAGILGRRLLRMAAADIREWKTAKRQFLRAHQYDSPVRWSVGNDDCRLLDGESGALNDRNDALLRHPSKMPGVARLSPEPA